MATPNLDLICSAANAAEREGRMREAKALETVATLFRKEVSKCLDPRHPTTIDQADEAVADAWPYDGLLRQLRSGVA